MKLYYFLLTLLVLNSCADRKDKPQFAENENSEIEVYDFNELQDLLEAAGDDDTYVVNFWATWCKPCIKELPLFEALHNNENENLKVILVSLDFPGELESKLIPFVKENELRSQVVLLDDPYENEWIPKVDSTWSGAIPATLIFNRTGRSFYEKSFTEKELNDEIIKFTKT